MFRKSTSAHEINQFFDTMKILVINKIVLIHQIFTNEFCYVGLVGLNFPTFAGARTTRSGFSSEKT
jgi:hypothetical protein